MMSTILRNGIVIAVIFTACSPPKAPPINFQQGKVVYENSCKACHGAQSEGNVQVKSPGLANLDGGYLLRQFMNFRNGVRGGQSSDTLGNQMAIIAKTLTDTLVIRDVIAYIDSLPELKSKEILSYGDWKKGERTYQDLCGSCHGASGRGNPKLNAPQLNGLESWYLRSQFKKFKSGLRGSHPEDKFGAQMTSIVQVLKDEQSVTDVITYLRSELSELPTAK